MAWEQRGNNRYYYRKRREGDTVYSEYVGHGQLAETMAAIDEREREREEEARRAMRAKMKAELDIDRQLNAAGAMVRKLRNAIMIANGYHTHKGQWRLQRDASD